MKSIFLIVVLPVSTILCLSSFSLRENPQDPPRGKKTEKHIKMVRIDDNGNKSVLDTVISGDQVFVWKGDTLGKDLKWITRDSFIMDSLHKQFDLDFDFLTDDGNRKVRILKSEKGRYPEIYEFRKDSSSRGSVMILKKGGRDTVHFDHRMFPGRAFPGRIPLPPNPPALRFLGKSKADNVIDLSDKGIISYKKRKLSKGREKITIIRNEPDEKEIREFEHLEIGPNARDIMIKRPRPVPSAGEVRVIKKDDGTMEIFRDTKKVMSVNEDSDNVKVIHEDGKVIMIREKKAGEGKNVEVEVEVEENKENKVEKN